LIIENILLPVDMEGLIYILNKNKVKMSRLWLKVSVSQMMINHFNVIKGFFFNFKVRY